VLLALQRHAPEAPTKAAAPHPGDPTTPSRRTLRCLTCAHPIADPDDRSEQLGAHEHIFVNPHGHDYRIRLYTHASGAVPVGPLTTFYSWFPGHPYRVLVCGSCLAHLGWSYDHPPTFVALIADRLSETPDD
jgi:hypothetical protein